MSTISCYPAISKWASLRLQSLFWQINPTRRQFIPPLCDLYVRFKSDATFAVLCQFCFLVEKYNFVANKIMIEGKKSTHCPIKVLYLIET